MGESPQRAWLAGIMLDPLATSLEPLPTLPGFPYLHAGMCALISGPTGAGRSALVEAGLYEAAKAGLRGAYVGNEITVDEFNARAAKLAAIYGDVLDTAMCTVLKRVHYLDLSTTVDRAWHEPQTWAECVPPMYDIVVIDPLSSAAASLGVSFDKESGDYIKFYDKLVQPILTAGTAVVLLDNIGHDHNAANRAKGASGKQDRADLILAGRSAPDHESLILTATKVRTVRKAFDIGHEWKFERQSQRIIDIGRTREDQTRADREAVSRFIEANTSCTTRDIRTGSNVPEKRVSGAITQLLADGYIERVPGPRNALLHQASRPYRQADKP